jgi:hypothetical protein
MSIPPRYAAVFWNSVGDLSDEPGRFDMRISELRVVDIRERGAIDACSALVNSRGAVCAEWLDGSESETPRGLFLELVTLEGFASEAAKLNALLQFGKIDGQEWARRFAAELGHPNEETEDA